MDELGIAVLTALSGLLYQNSETTLLFAGDAMMHSRQIDAAATADGSFDFSEYFSEVAPLISEADYAVVNLETPVAGGRLSGYPMFNAPDAYVDALQEAGFDLMLTANNHTLDRRDAGLKRTANLLNAKGLDHIGTYINPSQRDSIMPFVKNINGFNIGFLNYTYGTNGIDIQGSVVVDYIDRDKMKRDISNARNKGAELVCVAVHWGDEYKLLPNTHQKSLADFLFDHGADMVIGGHPHVIQPMELRKDAKGKNKLLVYSLGNFISGMKTRDTRGGAIARVKIKRDAFGNAIIEGADYDLVFTVPCSPPHNNFRLVFADSYSEPQWLSECKAFRTAATEVFDKHNKDVNRRAK